VGQDVILRGGCYEVVVNEIRQDQVIGYLSVPKLKVNR